jgi:AP-1 complex subunit mu
MVSVQKGNPNVAMVLTFLYKIRDVFKSYFKELEDESLRDNFVITYELLDEMMDNGYPQITEVKILQEYIKTGANQMNKGSNKGNNKFDSSSNLVVPTAASNAVSWRNDGIKH